MTKSFTPEAENARAFRDALGSFVTGVTAVTVDTPTGPMGFIANSFTSLSMDPPLVLWSVAKSAGRFPFYEKALHFAIHILGEDQADLLQRFHRNGAGFAGLDHAINDKGVPLLPGALARFECEQHATHEGGDHLIVVGRVQSVAMQDGAPMVFSKGQIGRFSAV